ncbi:UbiA prenyltransferase family protein [Fulvivirga lutea]|uniref:UbiA prenyltransferase family protein n=1 Tax=Fulvivirga lutea TaxID=2810512 RepID=A0A974WPK8_9BACT|nr:UbiA family prenyltransferase [Fulvivirga lutea]QSE99318.1 UbiA prenyltransferase family protein [Fulvivirga lutea]
MFNKSAWLHLRIPFSFFLMPVFLFALAVSSNVSIQNALIVFICLHIFLYPASNGYNSYFDKDEGSIGSLKNPPKVNKGLYYLSLIFDFIALLLAAYNIAFLLMILVYGLVSKAYSHPLIRLKKYPFGSWLIAGFFQGAFTFMMSYIGINDIHFFAALDKELLLAAILTSVMLWGSYPMTQIYQHEEDYERGDITLSYKLGILGTFHFVGLVFSLSSLGFVWYFNSYFNLTVVSIYLIMMAPVIGYFSYWYFKVRKDKQAADFDHTMKLNFISASCLNIFFIYLFLC